MGYGLGSRSPSVSAVETTAPQAGSSPGLYTFSGGVRKVKIQVHPDAAGDVYVRWNASSAGKALDGNGQCGWNDVLQAGDSVVFPGTTGDALVTQVAIWIDTAMVYGTDFNIEGWR